MQAKHIIWLLLSTIVVVMPCSGEETAPTTAPDKASEVEEFLDQVSQLGNTLRVSGTAVIVDRAREKAAYLGVTAMPMSVELQQHLRLSRGIGLTISHVQPDSPAAAADLQKHDVLYKLNDQLVVNAEQLAVLVRMHKPGDEVEVTVIRAGQPLTLKTTLAEKELPRLHVRAHAYGDPPYPSPNVFDDARESLHKARERRLKVELAALETQLSDMQREVDQARERGDDEVAAKLERRQRLVARKKEHVLRTLERSHRMLMGAVATGKPYVRLIRWNDDDWVIELEVLDSGRYKTIAKAVQGERAISLEFEDVSEVPESIRPRIKTLLDVMQGKVGNRRIRADVLEFDFKSSDGRAKGPE